MIRIHWAQLTHSCEHSSLIFYDLIRHLHQNCHLKIHLNYPRKIHLNCHRYNYLRHQTMNLNFFEEHYRLNLNLMERYKWTPNFFLMNCWNRLNRMNLNGRFVSCSKNFLVHCNFDPVYLHF